MAQGGQVGNSCAGGGPGQPRRPKVELPQQNGEIVGPHDLLGLRSEPYVAGPGVAPVPEKHPVGLGQTLGGGPDGFAAETSPRCQSQQRSVPEQLVVDFASVADRYRHHNPQDRLGRLGSLGPYSAPRLGSYPRLPRATP